MSEPGSAAIGGPARRLLHWLARIASAALIIGGLAWAAHAVDHRAFVQALRSADRALVLGAAVTNVVALALQAWRWQLLLAPLRPVRYLDAFAILVCGFAVSSVVPARAGELARLHLLVRRTGMQPRAVGGTLVLDHVVNALCLAPFVVLLPFSHTAPGWVRATAAVLLGVAVLGGAAVWLLAHPRQDGPPRGRVGEMIAHVREGFGAIRSMPHASAAFAAGIAAWGAEALVVGFTLAAFGIPMTPGKAGLVLVTINAALALPAPPANLGTLEVGAVLAATAIGGSQESAVAFALVFHAVHLLSVWTMALPLWLRLRRSPGSA